MDVSKNYAFNSSPIGTRFIYSTVNCYGAPNETDYALLLRS